MPTPNPKPEWMTDEDYADYVNVFNYNENSGNQLFDKLQKQAGMQQKFQVEAGAQTQPPLIQSPAKVAQDQAEIQQQLQQLQQAPPQQLFQLPLVMPGQEQFITGTGMFDRLVADAVDKSQVEEYNAVVADLIAAGYPSEQDVVLLTEQWLQDNGYDGFNPDPQERQAYLNKRAELLEQEDWAEKMAYKDLFSEESSPRRPRAASEAYQLPAPSIGSSQLTRKTPEEISQMGTWEVIGEALKPQVLETQEMREARKVREGYLKSMEETAVKRAESDNIDIDRARELVYTEFFSGKQAQAKEQARNNYSQYTGRPVELAAEEEVNKLARDIYLQFLQNNFPDEYRTEIRRGPDTAAFGIESDQTGAFFTVWGDAIHRGFLTNEVDVTGLRTVLYDVGILEDPDLITETMAGALVRDIGGLVRMPINPIKEMLTYSVDPYSGKPLDENDWGLFPVEELGKKEDAAWGKTIILPEGTGAWEDYWKTSAYEIATMRTLGDDIASLQMVPEDYETTVRVGGLLTEFLIPISPKAWLAPVGLAATGTGKLAKGGYKIAKGATAPQIAAKEAKLSALQAERFATQTLIQEAGIAGDVQRAADLNADYVRITNEADKLGVEITKAREAAEKIDLTAKKIDYFTSRPVQATKEHLVRRAQLEKPFNEAAQTFGYSDAQLLALKADDVVDLENYAQRYANEVGRFVEDLVAYTLGAKTAGTERIKKLGLTQAQATDFLNAMSAQGEKTIVGKLGLAAEAEINQFTEFVSRAPEMKKEFKALTPVEVGERLERFRAGQALGDTRNPYRNLAKEELLNSMYTEYVPLTSRMIVSRKAMKQYWPKFQEEILTSRARYLVETGDPEKPFRLTQEGATFINQNSGMLKSGQMKGLINTAIREGDVLLDAEQSLIVSDRLAEAIARKVFGQEAVLKPTRATPAVERAFIPEQRRLFTDTMFEGTSVGAKKLYRAIRENISIPVYNNVRKRFGKTPLYSAEAMAPPMWARNTAKGIEEGIAALDNGMMNAFNATRRAIDKRRGTTRSIPYKQDANTAEQVFRYMFEHAARGGDPMEFIRDADRIIDAIDAAATMPNNGNSKLLKGLYLALKHHIGPGIKTEVDAQIFIDKFREAFQVNSRVNPQRLREFGRDVPRLFLENEITMFSNLSSAEIMTGDRMYAFIESLPTHMRKHEVIEQASAETLKFLGTAPADIETSLIQFIFGRARDKVVERVITREINKGGTGVIGQGAFETLTNKVHLNNTSSKVRSAESHPLKSMLTEEQRAATPTAQRPQSNNPVKVLEEDINEFNLTPAGQRARAEFIGAVTQNIMKYGVYSPDEQLYIAFDRYMNQVRKSLTSRFTMDILRDNIKFADQAEAAARQAGQNPEAVAQARKAAEQFNKQVAEAEEAIRPYEQQLKNWDAAKLKYETEYAAWEAKKDAAGKSVLDDDYFEWEALNPSPTRPKILDQPRPESVRDRNIFMPDDVPPGTTIVDGKAVATVDMNYQFDTRVSPSDLFRDITPMGEARAQEVFDEMVHQLVYNEPYGIVANLQTQGIVAGYLTESEFLQHIQNVMVNIGKDKFAVVDSATAQMLRQLQDDFGALALKDNYSGFSANFYEIRRRNPFFIGQMIADFGMIARGARRNIVSGQLAGKYIPNFPYQSENILTAPLIASVTAPDYMATVMRQGLQVGYGGAAEVLRNITNSRFNTPMSMTPSRQIEAAINLGKGDDVWFTTVRGEKITYNRAAQLLLENNTGRSQQALQLGETLINDIKAAARTSLAHVPQGMPRTGTNLYIEFANAISTGRTPSYAHWANGADQAMREAVFFRALEAGVETSVAANLGRNVVLDYGSVPVWMRKQLGGLFLYTSFMYKMTSEVMSSMFRGARQTQALNKPAVNKAREFLSGTPVQNLVRAAIWKKAVHNNTGEWILLNDNSKATLWSTYLGEYDNTDAYMVGLRDPVISQVLMIGNFMDYIYQAGGGYADKPLGVRTVEGLLDNLYSPSIDFLMTIKDIKSGQRVPVKFVQMMKYTGIWPEIMTYCDIEVIKDPTKQRAGEPIFEGQEQYKFRTQGGAENFKNLQYVMQIMAAQRIGQDITATLIAMDAVPPGTEFFRYTADAPKPEGLLEGDALLDGAAYLIIRNRPVRVPKEWQAYDAVLMKNKSKLELKGKRGR